MVQDAVPGGSGTGSHRPWAVIVVALVVILLVMIRVGSSGSDALSRGDAAHAAGDHLGAAAAWREAISWVLPVGASWRGAAMERLEALADEREAAGDLSGAVMALSSLRSGILAGHGLWRPDVERVTATDGRLAPLLAAWEAEDARETGRSISGDRSARVAFFRAQLGQEVRPNRAMSLVAILGFLSWLLGTYGATVSHGRARGRALGIAAVGFLAMVMGVAWA